MKRVFTLVLVMAMAITGFAQVKGLSHKAFKPEPAQTKSFTGFEVVENNYVSSPRSIMVGEQEEEVLSYTTYDWQSNMAARNFTAVWPDGYAVMCYTQASDASYSDRGTGLAIWDPEVGEWEFTESRVEDVKTGFGSIARYKENGLVIAAHTATDCRIFLVEDFRDGNREFGEGIILPTEGDEGREQDPCWPVVQCSGENLDIVHIIATEATITEPYGSALLYTRYENEEFTVKNHILPNLDTLNMSDGGSNICYFMQYDPERPNRVAFVLNNAWSDGKAVISEDNGDTWEDERIFYQHPGIDSTYSDWFFYPRWTGAAFDNNDKLHIVYEYNGTTGEPGSGSYYPAIGGIGYWSEVLPKHDSCVGGIGEYGQPFIMDTVYLMHDIYYSEWYWGDADHMALPEYIGELERVDTIGNVVPRDADSTAVAFWPTQSTWGDHGSYNGGKAAFATMHYDKPTNRIFAFWSQICGDEENFGMDLDHGEHFLRLFGNMSLDGGRTWRGTKAFLTSFEKSYTEMVYDQVIPYLYTDDNGEYLWVLIQMDASTGTFVQQDDSDPDDNYYGAVKVYVDVLLGAQEDQPVVAFTPMVNVYPNPANGSFTVKLNNNSNVNIYNTVGQLVKTYNNVVEVNVDLEPGMYFVNAGNQTVKVIVK